MSIVVEPGVSPATEEIYQLIRTRLRPHFEELARCQSTPELLAHPRYQELRPLIERVLETPETGSFAQETPPARPRYRVLAWNIERGIELDAQIDAFRHHSYLRDSDVLLLTETDIGMARSRNRAVAQELARALSLHYAFIPCYLNLSKGSGIEHQVEGQNEIGLHGNAVLSRYPIRSVHAIPLKNGKDKMAGREKRIGRQTTLAAEIEFPNGRIAVGAVHLDANSTQRHRQDQMRDVLDRLAGERGTIIGGDWNTTTYNSSRAFTAILGFWLRVFMGVDHVIRHHYLHPYNHFEKQLFDLLERRGFDYRSCNLLGERTISYDVGDGKTYQNLREWVPNWCFAFIRWALRNHDGRCPLKLDWFATRGLRAKDPVVLHEFREGRERPLSDHDPIGVEILL